MIAVFFSLGLISVFMGEWTAASILFVGMAFYDWMTK